MVINTEKSAAEIQVEVGNQLIRLGKKLVASEITEIEELREMYVSIDSQANEFYNILPDKIKEEY